MNDPSMQSVMATPHTPQAMLIPDHGTTPIRRNTERRTQADDFGFDLASKESGLDCKSPSMALRVISRARGKKCVRNGASGVDNRVAHAEPIVVSAERSIVANTGEKRAPARTFWI
jgi:hypothetical protein